MKFVTGTNKRRARSASCFFGAVVCSALFALRGPIPPLPFALGTSSTTRGTSRGLETSLDTGDGPRRTARRARHEEESVVLGQGRVRRLARLALFRDGGIE